MNKKLYSEVEKLGYIFQAFQYGSYAELLTIQWYEI